MASLFLKFFTGLINLLQDFMLYNSFCSYTHHEKIGLHPRSYLILSSTCMMTDQIGLQSVLLSLQITANHVQSFCYSFGCNHIYDDDEDDDDDDDDDYVRNNHRYHSDYSSNDVNDSNMKIFEYILCKNIHTTVFGFSTQI